MAIEQAHFSATDSASVDWIDDVAARLHPCDRQQACDALRVTLRALRDRLDLDAAHSLAAQLPAGLRTLFMEGWRPEQRVSKERSVHAFAVRIARQLPPGFPIAPNRVVGAVFATTASHVGDLEARKIAEELPKALRVLWPPASEDAGRAPGGKQHHPRKHHGDPLRATSGKGR